MLKKPFSLTLILLIINTAFVWAADVKNNRTQSQKESDIKRKVSKLGVQTPIKLELNDGRKFRGRIGEINDDNFIILLGIKDDRMAISYTQVKQVKDFLSPGKGTKVLGGIFTAWILIGITGMIVTVIKGVIK